MPMIKSARQGLRQCLGDWRDDHNCDLAARCHARKMPDAALRPNALQAAVRRLFEPVRVSTKIIAPMFIRFQTMPLINAVW